MAQIKLYITVEGAASPEEAERLAMRLLLATKPAKTVLVGAGHTVTAKAAAPCQACGALTDVRGELCPVCAGAVAVDRVLDEPGRVSFPAAVQAAEAAVM